MRLVASCQILAILGKSLVYECVTPFSFPFGEHVFLEAHGGPTIPKERVCDICCLMLKTSHSEASSIKCYIVKVVKGAHSTSNCQVFNCSYLVNMTPALQKLFTTTERHKNTQRQFVQTLTLGCMLGLSLYLIFTYIILEGGFTCTRNKALIRSAYLHVH